MPGVLVLSPRDRDRACWYSFQCHELIPWPQEGLKLGAKGPRGALSRLCVYQVAFPGHRVSSAPVTDGIRWVLSLLGSLGLAPVDGWSLADMPRLDPSLGSTQLGVYDGISSV